MTAQSASLMVIFGATGDLAQRMLLPSLYGLQRDGYLRADLKVLCTGRSELTPDAFRQSVIEAIERRYSAAERDAGQLSALLDRIHYQAAGLNDEASLGALIETIKSMRNGDVVYHLSTAPRFYAQICAALGAAGLAGPGTRALLEKPIGHDLASSIEINDGVGRVFDEERIFRVDHYLGKEGVQNLLALRFGNALFEPLWNARHIAQVQITVAETVGVEGRGDYYDHSGAMRDMLRLAAGPGGTAPKAQTVGYSVGGKTGTARKQEGRGYSTEKYRSWFVGLAPVSAPKLVVAVMIDEPRKGGVFYGGEVAAPVFSSVVQQSLRTLGVAPDIDFQPGIVAEPGPAAMEST